MGRDSTSSGISWSVISRRLKEIYNRNDTSSKISDGTEFLKYVDGLVAQKDILLESAKRYGTPQYLLDEAALIDRMTLLDDAFQQNAGNVKIFYAFKCNDLPRIIQVLKEHGAHADVAGLYELELALKLGFDRIIFTSPGKSDEELSLAMKNPDRVVINIDNIDEFHRIISIYEKDHLAKHTRHVKHGSKRLRISFRMNVSDDSMGVWSKFGISLEELKMISADVKQYPFLSWEGLHFHSSWNDSPKNYVERIKKVSSFLSQNFSKEELSGLRFMDIGGGFMCEGSANLFSETAKSDILRLSNSDADVVPGSICVTELPGIEYFAKNIGDTFNAEIRRKLGLEDMELWIEPGRFIVSLSTHILVTVRSIKKNAKGSAIIVDGGINLIGGHDAESTFFPILNLSNPSHEIHRSIVYGPLCDPHDLWGYQYFGGEAKPGDVLAVMHQGAYTYATAWAFIRPIAKYVSFDKENLHVVKEEETFNDRYGGCKF